MRVYRLLKAPYNTDPLATIGSERSPGRWNQAGQGLLYTASHPALAMLETMVHFETVALSQLPALTLFELDVDETLIRTMNSASLPVGWNHSMYARITATYLNDWIEEPDSPAFDALGVAVPSAVLPMSTNYLFAPRHPQYRSIRLVASYVLPLDARLWRLR